MSDRVAFYKQAFAYLDSQSFVELYFPFVATTPSLLQQNDAGAVSFVGTGSCLFGEDGKPSTYTDQVLKFLKEYQLHFERTRRVGKHLKELDLLEPMHAQVTTPKGEKLAIGGFMAVPRKKLRALGGEALASLAKTDELELLYLHLYSMRNFQDVKDRLIGSSDITESAVPEGSIASVH